MPKVVDVKSAKVTQQLIRIDASTSKAVKQFADENNMTISEVWRKGVKKLIEHKVYVPGE